MSDVTITVKDVIHAIEKVAPLRLKMGGDPTGFQLGDPQAELERVLVCLEVNEEVVEEATAIGASLILSHHPLIFRPISAIVSTDPLSRLVITLLNHGIALYSAHTNLDRAAWGVSDALAEALGLENAEVLLPAEDLNYYKLVVFVPMGDVEAVSTAIGDAGAGTIGDYSHCTFRTSGTGTFLPQPGAHPTIGEVGKMSEVSEVRLEAIVPPNALKSVLTAMLEAHPYEEVAYDVIKLANTEPGIGLGRIGELPNEMTLSECLERWKDVFPRSLRVAGDPGGMIKRVAVCGGSGADLAGRARALGADLYITGDIKHHAAQDALAIGLSVIDAGHHATEKLVLPEFASRVAAILEAEGKSVEFVISKVNTDPWV